MTTIHLTLDQLPKAFKNFHDQIPFASARALNQTAFDIRRDLQGGELRRHMTLRNRHTERGIRVERANKHHLAARVGSIDYYMERQVQGSKQRPRIGIKYKGKRFLLRPSDDVKTKTGNVRKLSLAGKPAFVIKSKDGQFLLVRRKYKRKRYPLVILGYLSEVHDYNKRVPWLRITTQNLERYWRRNFTKSMVRAIRTAR